MTSVRGTSSRGTPGFAHLFEHMMFQGSQNVGKGEHLILVRVNGGDVNGTTSDDSTNYYERVPANQLDMALFLESDRMRALRITQANLDNQRNTVQEERRLRMDNQAYGKTDEILEDLAYDNFAYKHSTMGSMADLNAASLADVAQFFKTYYAPNNAVLIAGGRFQDARSACEDQEVFRGYSCAACSAGRWTFPNPCRPRSAGPGGGFLCPTAAARYCLQDGAREYAGLVRARYARRHPVQRHFLAAVPNAGEGKGVALQVAGGIDQRRGPSLFQAFAMLKPGQDPAEVEKLIYEEFERVKNDGVTPAEMKKVLIQDRLAVAESLTKHAESRAHAGAGRGLLPRSEPDQHGPCRIMTEVTPADIQRVARQYLGATSARSY